MSKIHKNDNILGQEAALFLENTTPVIKYLASTTVKYDHMANDEFMSLLEKNPPHGMQIYWQELIGRAHFAASASMIRSFQWCQGMLSSERDGLFLPYCASFRGLLESIADTYDALNNVAISLAQNHVRINECLEGSAKYVMCSQELEDQLIHFTYARKLEKEEKAPTSHQAKTAANYLAKLSLPNGLSAKELYAELCQFTHPAAHSVRYLIINHDGQDILYGKGDQARIRGYSKQKEKYLLPLLMLGFNPGFLVLKVLRSLIIDKYHAPIVDQFILDNIPAWKKINSYLSNNKPYQFK